MPAYARPLEGPFGEGIRPGVQEALRHFLAEIEAGGPVAAARRLFGPGPGRDAGRAQPRVAAQRLPDRRPGGLAAVRGARRRRPGSSPTPCTCWPSRSSPTSTCCRRSRPRATRWSSRPRPSEAELRRRRLVRMLVRDPPPEPEAVEAAAADAGWPLPRTLAVLAIGGEQRGRGRVAAARRLDQRGDRRADLRAGRRPRRARPAGGDRAGGRPAPGRGAGLGTTVDWTQARLSFVARAGRAGAGRVGAPGWWPPASGPANCCCAPIRGSPASSPPTGWRRWPQLSPGSRQRLTETLAVWLAEQGRLGQVAAAAGDPPADRALPARAPARAVRRGAGRPRRALLARAGAAVRGSRAR